jgi:CBS-domain-containing membrane protein
VRDFPLRDRQVIEIDCESTISDAFGVLLTHNILCAPVWDATQQGYLGFFDVDDALNIAYDIDLLGGKTKEAPARLRTTAVKVLDVFVKSNLIRNPEMQAPWVAVGPSVCMKDVVDILATAARRVPVVDPTSGRCVKLVSQMDVCRQLYSSIQTCRPHELPACLLQTPQETGLGMKPVIVVTEDHEARDAFRAIIDNCLSAVGVVDEAGKLAGCISNKDIQIVTKGAAPSSEKPKKLVAPMMAAPTRARGRFSIANGTMGNADFFSMPALMFVFEVRKQMEQGGKTHAAVVVATPDTPFKDIIEKLATSHHHRVFLVNDAHEPVGVVSVADICQLVASNLVPPPAVPPPVPTRNKPVVQEE